MGMPTKICKSQSVMVVCLLLAFLCANMNRVWCFNGIQTGDWGNSNNTTTMRRAVARIEYINDADDDEEFLMDSDVNRRILAATGGSGGIDYKILQEGQVICNSPGKYGDCIPTNNTAQERCGFEDRCQRHVPPCC